MKRNKCISNEDDELALLIILMMLSKRRKFSRRYKTKFKRRKVSKVFNKTRKFVEKKICLLIRLIK